MSSAKIIDQAVLSVLSFSSQYGKEHSRSYSAHNLMGPPSRYPSYGDFTEAAVLRTYGTWWTMAPSAIPRIQRNVGKFLSQDFADLLYSKKVFPTKIDIYETYNPGAVVRILAWVKDKPSERIGKYTYRWEVLWDGIPEKGPEYSRILSPPIKETGHSTKIIRLEFNSRCCNYYTEIDAVILHGRPDESSKIGAPAIQALQNAMGKLSVKENASPKVDVLQRHVSLTSQPSVDEKESSGYFNMLPNELVSIILSYLTLEELGTTASTCRYFNIMCYDPIWFHEVDLQPYWHKITDSSLQHLASRCQNLERINLSWVGHARHEGGYLVAPETLNGFIEDCCKNVTVLQLSCCDVVTDSLLDGLPIWCPSLTDLDISSCSFSTANLVSLSKLPNLKRLNLYRMQVPDHILTLIFQFCKKLEHVNMGSNAAIVDGDQVLKSLGTHCQNLISLDLWHWKKITECGIMTVVKNCKDLQELDLGWCGNLKSGGGCIEQVAKSCPKLKKLFLTAVRSIGSIDVEAIAQHCPLMQQFDILGTAKVFAANIEKLLEKCTDLRLLDISFCSHITAADVEGWKLKYPHVEIKKSIS